MLNKQRDLGAKFVNKSCLTDWWPLPFFIKMKQRCQACGVEKDTETKEVYPYPEEDGITDEPIEPFFTLDCQGPRLGKDSNWREATVCHACFHKMDVDMWISGVRWQSLNPIISFEKLPKLHSKP